jgi:endo-1,4-beta-xylanase
MIDRRGFLAGAGAGAALLVAAGCGAPAESAPLWLAAYGQGLVYGSSTASWQLADPAYAALFRREAAILFTEDDLLWYRIRPTPVSGLQFSRPDRIVGEARSNGQLVFGAHLVWDQGFGRGWSSADLWGLPRQQARRLLFGTVHDVVARYRGQVVAWSCVNEAIADAAGAGYRGLRTDVPWFHTCGPDYVADTFAVAHAADPHATLVLNDFGFETSGAGRPDPGAKQAAALRVLDDLIAHAVPVHAFGIQAHLSAAGFAERFHAPSYQHFLRELAARGVRVMITELDVDDDGLPSDVAVRDRGVADVYRRYLDTALAAVDVAVVMTFGLSDRYTWLQQDYPRRDGAPRRPLPFDRHLRATPARGALRGGLAAAPSRPPWRRPPRA